MNVHDLFTWLPAGTLHVDFGVPRRSAVGHVAPARHRRRLADPPLLDRLHARRPAVLSRFFAYLNLFAASMLILVLGSSFLLTFLGWEGVGLCSYLLISFWFERNAAAVAGKKAFVTNRVGDVGFLLAMFLIFASYGSLDYARRCGAGAHLIGSGTATAIALLLFLARGRQERADPAARLAARRDGGPHAGLGADPRGHDGHRRRVPARAGRTRSSRRAPTRRRSSRGSAASPRCSPARSRSLQPDIKRVLAYSTVSQLGYMFLAVGVGAYSAAVFMVICHAFYKGCLFLGAGSVIHGNARRARTCGSWAGSGKFLPYTAWAMVVGWLAIAGVPPLVGLLVEGRDHHPGVPRARLRPVGDRARRRGLHRRST